MLGAHRRARERTTPAASPPAPPRPRPPRGMPGEVLLVNLVRVLFWDPPARDAALSAPAPQKSNTTPPPSRTEWIRRVPHPVLIGHVPLLDRRRASTARAPFSSLTGPRAETAPHYRPGPPASPSFPARLPCRSECTVGIRVGATVGMGGGAARLPWPWPRRAATRPGGPGTRRAALAPVRRHAAHAP